MAIPKISKMDFAGFTTDTRGTSALFHKYCPKRSRRTMTRILAITEPRADAPGPIIPLGLAKVSVREIAATVISLSKEFMVLPTSVKKIRRNATGDHPRLGSHLVSNRVW